MSIYADEFRRLLTDLEPDVPSATCYEAAGKWVELAKNPNYHVAEQCKAALDALLASKSWFDLLASKQPVDCVIDLGAGAGDKLALIASCLPTVTLIPLDVSLDMLLWAYGTLRSHQEGAATSAVIRPVRVDFAQHLEGLAQARALQVHMAARKLLTILGNTFGNFKESALMRQLGATMAADDILVIGQGLHRLSNGDATDVATELDWYGSEAFYAFWNDPVVCKDFHAAEKFSYVNTTGGQSEVSGSLAIETTAVGAPLPLMTSTRYDEGRLIAFITKWGFEHRFSIASPLSDFYHQLVFTKQS